MKNYLNKYGEWPLLVIGTIGIHFANYFVIMFSRILWMVGLVIIVARIISWLETRKPGKSILEKMHL